MRVVIDTNVLVSGLRSQRGRAFLLLERLSGNEFQPLISPPLCLEYEDVLKRPGIVPNLTVTDIEDFLDYFLQQSVECRIHFLWRPHLSDPKDDMVLELAIAGGAQFIVTFNVSDFAQAESLGIRAVTPRAFLAIIGAT